MAEIATDPPITDWRASLTGDFAPLATEKSLESFKGANADEVLPQIVKSFVETKRMVGAKTDGMVKVPGADAKPEDVAAFHKAIGVPDSPTGYQIKRPEVAATSWDETAEQGFLAAMHRAGAPAGAVQAAMNFYGEFVAGQLRAASDAAKTVDADLRREWGPNYDANLGRANRALQEYGGDALVEFLMSSGLGRHPLMVKAWAKVGNELVEHGAMPAVGISLGVDEAKAEMDRMFNDKSHAMHNENHPDHTAALDRWLALNKIAAKAA